MPPHTMDTHFLYKLPLIRITFLQFPNFLKSVKPVYIRLPMSKGNSRSVIQIVGKSCGGGIFR